MGAASKMLNGLRKALAYARGDCRHEFTYWEPRKAGHGWTRICTKCGVRETSMIITDEIRDQI